MTEPGPSPVLLDELAFTTLLRWVSPLTDDLAGQLALLGEQLRGRLDERQRAAVLAAIERLRMLQIVEQGLAVGDPLPEFALADADGRIRASGELLDRGPLALAFIRGAWCPYCSLCLAALHRAAPEIDAAGGSLAAVLPVDVPALARLRAERGLGLTLLADPDAAYARVCGVQYAMSDGQAALYRSFGLDLAASNDWGVPVPATYVAGRDGLIAYAFADPDWSRRAEPGEILATVRRLAAARP
jgi:peroxiredoxin